MLIGCVRISKFSIKLLIESVNYSNFFINCLILFYVYNFLNFERVSRLLK